MTMAGSVQTGDGRSHFPVLGYCAGPGVPSRPFRMDFSRTDGHRDG